MLLHYLTCRFNDVIHHAIHHTQGDIEDLCLTFSVSETDMGTQKEVDLVHLGSKIAVSGVRWSY
jgi:hypothetical protein